ncbi:hypothetical protein KRR39_09910 [Nocardioides panacis]|uniref:Uncharacterized protein n=1 Tax=Nocardioides panacis TaxID=2849501 RepID=A0A975Y1Z0_9ACTN|nr:hypothetical protein [Nocardioides panacis]QWZ10010.1 hypothetical protein KRR39_09910 [Nocardioides panacis]
MVRRLGSVLTVACLFLAGFAPVAAVAVAVPAGTAVPSAAVRARPALKVTVDWPTLPMLAKHVTVHVRRPGAGPTTTRLEMQVGSRWVTVVHKKVKARSFVFRAYVESGRVRLRVVLPHVTSRIYTAPMQAPLVRRVDYADGPVQTRRSWSDRVIALVFKGRRGQLVDLATVREEQTDDCTADRLRGPSGKVIAAARPGMWRLPRTATYRVEAVPCWAGWVSSADLTLVRLVPLDLDAAPVRLHAGNGVTDAGVVTVPETGRVMVRGWDPSDPSSGWRSVTSPTGLRQPPLMYLEAGKSFSNYYHSGVITPGRYLFYPGKDNLKASASSPLTTSITPEGPAVTLGDDGVPGRPREFTFTATAGTFVYPDKAYPQSAGGLSGPDGGGVGDWHYGQGWLLRKDGRYTLGVTPNNADTETGTPMTVRLRQAVTLPPMQYGAPTRFALDGSDRWLVSTIDVPQSSTHRLTASGSTMTGAWEAIGGSSFTQRCAPTPQGPNGCNDNYFTTVNQDTPTAAYRPWGSNPALVVLRPGAGVTGSVDLTLGP